ncbi:MAG: hypothetical protein UX28_C0003G0159 [Candidatus Pacebacteria bacterium GW2011_GWA1_46_10]|nr:MAG: hypothetical protein UX28_C0003G0159 [Candidatus Pacebacteria bacterium GW2011_GWA1_46_10]HCR81605.1 hypothetical protein [Candidatus Paceibacterota bacterium]
MDLQTIKQQALPVLKKHRVSRAAVFGSAVQGEMTAESDVDFLVELPNDVHGFDYIALKLDLEDELKKSLGRDVDVVEYKLIKPSLKSYILPTQMPIY